MSRSCRFLHLSVGPQSQEAPLAHSTHLQRLFLFVVFSKHLFLAVKADGSRAARTDSKHLVCQLLAKLPHKSSRKLLVPPPPKAELDSWFLKMQRLSSPSLSHSQQKTWLVRERFQTFQKMRPRHGPFECCKAPVWVQTRPLASRAPK